VRRAVHNSNHLSFSVEDCNPKNAVEVNDLHYVVSIY